jgi:hypothetical protein
MNVNDNVKAKSDNNNNNNNNKPSKQESNKNNKYPSCHDTDSAPCLDNLGGVTYYCDDKRAKAQFEKNGEGGCIVHGGESTPFPFSDSNSKSDGQKQEQNTGGKGKITVGYGDLGGYSGKGKIVIKNQDTGQTLVTHDLNFAKLRASEGNDCCYKVYTFDSNKTHYGDTISAVVTAGDGSWESGPFKYKNNLQMGMTLDEIGEDDKINYDSNYNKDDHTKKDDIVCDSDKDTKAPSCDEFEKEFQGDDNNENNKEQKPDFGSPDEDFEVEGNLSG